MSFARSRAKIYADDDVKVQLRRRRRRRRSGERAARDRRVPQEPEEVHEHRRPHPEGRAARRSAGHRQDAARPGGRRRGGGAVLQPRAAPSSSRCSSASAPRASAICSRRPRAKAPCIVFIDELDALGKVRIQTPMGSHEEREQTLNQLLAEMDGFDASKGVIIMGATNRPEVLDPALLRPGPLRSAGARRQAGRARPRGDPADPRQEREAVATDVDLKVIAARTAGFAGADLANLVNEAALLAARKDKTAVEMKRLRRGDRSRDRRAREEARDEPEGAAHRRVPRVRARDRRERAAGARPGAQDLDRAARLRRARLHDAAPARRSLPDDARRTCSASCPCCSAAARAEEIAFDEISTGAQNDLQRATDIARAMVTEFGMSDALGAIELQRPQARRRSSTCRSCTERGPLLGGDRAEDRRRGQAHHDRGARPGAPGPHGAPRRRSTMLVGRLLEKEVIEADELKAIIGPLPPKVPTRAPEIPPSHAYSCRSQCPCVLTARTAASGRMDVRTFRTIAPRATSEHRCH